MDKSELKKEILKLKKEKNATIVAHYYQNDEIQEIADIRGDSLALAIEASKLDSDIIVFCGVKFMAETAKVISPKKKVLLPVLSAGCPLADTAKKEAVLKRKKELNNPAIVSYVNTNVDVKTISDICCTSANAVNVVKSIKEKRILFVPDKNLGEYVKEQLKDKEIFLWDGACPTHDEFKVDDLKKLKKEHPQAKIAVHPESSKALRDAADFVGSTSGIINYATRTDADEFIIGTEEGILYELKLRNPSKKFYIIGGKAICYNMKKITLKELYEALKEEKHEILLDDETIELAKKPIEKMIAIKRN
ncbi:quinolinate synthase NadA [Hippea maritima]|uniref:Quinolinate synthase n=1 Tax=Hippea maritima (strain ATCC 700847 / DSM 10411 / MH2) TaxID=760142 RepID=F2LU47_HIPMA|nr:quinolinate synthase NadA [Hippea maritima]AEA34510.1 Quinolinate synthase A [Hippea maritima DSM 10411]